MMFCIECGSNEVKLQIPTGDNRQRHICLACNYIHYVNPRIICGTLPTFNGQVLLCKREIEPRSGFWTLPAGFMENGESLSEAAYRETFEEALATSVDLELYTLCSLPHINQVHIFYRCEILDGKFGAGSETLDAKLFDLADIPWDELAFKTVAQCLEFYQQDIQQGLFPIRSTTIKSPYQTREA